MDLSKIKNGNDFMKEMFADQETDRLAQEEGVQSVDNDGAEAPVDELELNINDEGSADVDKDKVQINTSKDNATEELLDDWDTSDKGTTEVPTFDFKELGKALNIEGVESKDALVSKVTEIVTKSKELEQKVAAYSSIPEPLKEAIELANKGGDYLEFLGISTLDYDAIDDRTLIEDELISLGLFKKGDGSVDEESLAEYVDSLEDREVRVQGAKARNRLKHEQDQQRKTIQQKADEQRKQSINDLRIALDKLNNVGPFKLKPDHKKEMFDLFVNGQMMKELFYNKEGRFDYGQALEIVFNRRHKDKIEQLMKEAIASKTKKSVVSEIKNVDLGTSARTAKAETPGTADPLDIYMRKLQGLK